MTYIVSNIVSLTAVEIFDVQYLWHCTNMVDLMTMICLIKPEVEIIQLPNLQHLFTLYEAICVQNFVRNAPILKKLQ